jgi:putative oxidoreductase
VRRLGSILISPPPAHPMGASVGLLFLRIVAGSALVLHGLPKIKNPFGWMGETSTMPGWLQALAALSEFAGGMALVAGLLTPLAALGILCTLAVAVYKHMAKGDPFVGRGGYETALIYVAIAVLMLTAGPGRFSVDRILFGREHR